MNRQFLGGLSVSVALMALAGCGGGSSTDDSSDGGTSPSSSSQASQAPSTPAETPSSDDAGSGTATLTTADSTFGTIIVDSAGRSLYMYEPDAQGASTCYGGCATAWPPLTVDGTPGIGDGVDDSKLGTTTRTDGTIQVTYDGWPLYYWKNDASAGDVTGQGVGGVWWVIDPDGDPIRATPTA